MRSDYAEVFRCAEAVEKYDTVVYAKDSYGSAINARQRAFLRRLVKQAYPHRRPVQHDFACGTGRGIRLLHGLVRAAHGYDSSPEMLARAAGHGVLAKLHEVSPTGDLPVPATTEPPAIVTIFRLLLNVPDEVRERAIAFAARVLPQRDSGLLVIENHGHARSMRHLANRGKRDDPWFSELSHPQVTELLSRHGFTVVARHGFALFSRGWYGRPWLRPAIRRLDDLLCRIGVADQVATNVLYVARRTHPQEPR